MSKKNTILIYKYVEVQATEEVEIELRFDEIIKELTPEQLLELKKKITEKLEELGIKPELSKYEIIEKNKKENKSILNYAEQ